MRVYLGIPDDEDVGSAKGNNETAADDAGSDNDDDYDSEYASDDE